MFTGLIEEVGKVEAVQKRADGLQIKVKAKKVLEDVKTGDSIAVNGVCLTVISFDDKSVSFDVSNETVSRTTFKNVQIGEAVNLERALKVSDRLGGHIVQGHVDTTATIVEMTNLGQHTKLGVKVPSVYTPLVVEKGSIAIDGISLTVNQILQDTVFINIIPHTFENTNLKYKKIGNEVNVEFDIFGKYIFKMLNSIDITKAKDKRLLELLEGM